MPLIDVKLPIKPHKTITGIYTKHQNICIAYRFRRDIEYTTCLLGVLTYNGCLFQFKIVACL